MARLRGPVDLLSKRPPSVERRESANMGRRRQRRFVRLADRLAVVASDVDATDVDGRAMITSGHVTVNGLVVTNPNSLVSVDAVVAVSHQVALRGTEKLRAALAVFNPGVSGRVCLDLGAAAGGFTAALLEGGALRVYAVDAGYGQLSGRLRQDPRVVNLERTNLASLGPSAIPEPVSLLCVDLSYLAIGEALPQLKSVELAREAELLALVKPTFELRAGSLISDDEAIRKAVDSAAAAARDCGWRVDGRIVAVRGRLRAQEAFIFGAHHASRREGGVTA